jgi:hypothetical protein
MSPSDLVGPSPVTSNGTETTEIEDEASDEVAQLNIIHENRMSMHAAPENRPKTTPPKLSSSAESMANVCSGF